MSSARIPPIQCLLTFEALARLRSAQGPGRDWGTRLAGAVLVAAALAALGMDLGRQILDYCF